jgi:hypothetical protein
LQARWEELDARRAEIEAEHDDPRAALELWLTALGDYVTACPAPSGRLSGRPPHRWRSPVNGSSRSLGGSSPPPRRPGAPVRGCAIVT